MGDGTPERIRTTSVARSAPQGALPPHGARLRSLSSPGAVARRTIAFFQRCGSHGEDSLPHTLSVDGSNLISNKTPHTHLDEMDMGCGTPEWIRTIDARNFYGASAETV